MSDREAQLVNEIDSLFSEWQSVNQRKAEELILLYDNDDDQWFVNEFFPDGEEF